MDWTAGKLSSLADAYRETLTNHRLLAAAFACNPPQRVVQVFVPCFEGFQIRNPDGVTVHDVVEGVGAQ